jgi:hypothetical protein
VDGKNFSTIGKVNAAGNSTTENNYSYEDATAALLNKSGIYYRLQEADKDGTINLSNIVLVKMNTSESTFSVYPDPANDVINLDINNETGNASILLIDITGKITQQQNQTIQAGNIPRMKISNIAAGIYFIEAIINGKKYETQFIKE